jgi:uncharacterized protein YdhG (YjbR/CyaY superfamily)
VAQRRPASSIDEYINAFPQDIQSVLRDLRAAIREAAPDAEEAISYQMPAFKLNGNLVYFAAFKEHISLYPAGAELAPLKKQLAPYSSGKGTLRFPLDRPIPLDLVKRVIALRARENREKLRRKSGE